MFVCSFLALKALQSCMSKLDCSVNLQLPENFDMPYHTRAGFGTAGSHLYVNAASFNAGRHGERP